MKIKFLVPVFTTFIIAFAAMTETFAATKVPARAKGQESMLQYAAPALDTVRVGFIGLGMRGVPAVQRFTYLSPVKIVALCDIEPECVEKAGKVLAKAGLPAAAKYVGKDAWKELCERPDIDLVYICTDWLNHTPMAVYAMQHGKHVAIEVPAALTIKECWDLVNTSEITRRHCMMLENCVYDFFEMSTLQMAQKGLFGELLYGEAGYIHNLDIYWSKYHDNWRLSYNQNHRGDVYPTHGIGPLCQAFNIHRGDRFDYIVSIDTKSVHGKQVAKELMDADEYANGDHTTSLIRTVNGKVIEIQHNVYASRPYSRIHAITGTEGYCVKYPQKNICLKGDKLEGGDYDSLDGEKFVSKQLLDSLLIAYEPAFVKEIKEQAKAVGGHGGMDFIMDYRLVYCLHHGLPLDEDVYDAAEWCCISELSRLSIEHGSAPMTVPDFTRGDWNKINGFSYHFAE